MALKLAVLAAIVIFFGVVSATDLFPDDIRVKSLDGSGQWGGYHESMKAWVMENYPIEEFGSVMTRISSTHDDMPGCPSCTMGSYAGQMWDEEIPNIVKNRRIDSYGR